MMSLEIVGGMLFGSIALIADGLHMSTHAGALLLAALAYRYARRHVDDPRFTFGTGKLGDLAGFSSAVILAMIAALVVYEAAGRFIAPVPIHFREAVPIACLGLATNLWSVWLLSGGGHDHHLSSPGGGLGHAHGRHRHGHAEAHSIATARGPLVLSIFEDGVPPRFRLQAEGRASLRASPVTIETERPDGTRQVFALAERDGYFESVEEIPEPHAFTARFRADDEAYEVAFEEPAYHPGAVHPDNNMRAAIIHVVADATVSVCVIISLILARLFGWLWIDPLVGIVGACVIASWSYALIRDTGAVLLDMNPDHQLADDIHQLIEAEGDRIADLHLWRLGPGHLGAIASVETSRQRGPAYYHDRLAHFRALSHVTIEVNQAI
jgi:cation diffusion facilitator family transporter